MCGEARDGVEATELARKLQPDVVLMDMSMPRMGGAEATKIIRREVPSAEVIVVTQNEGSVVRRQLAEIGARAYVSKTSVTQDLIPTIEEVTGDVEKKKPRKGAARATDVPSTREATDKTEVSQVLAETEDRLRRAMETAELGLWNWYPGQDLATWENQKMYEIFGRSPHDGPISSADFLGKFVHAGDTVAYQDAMKEALEKHKRFFFQGRFYRADGQLRWVEFRGRSEFRADGSVARIMGTARDISDFKLAEEMVRRQRERYDLVAQATQVGFWFCDLPFDKLNWDHRVKEHFWLPPDAEVTIQTFYERLHPEDRERTRKAIEYSNQNDTPYDIEYRTVSPDGRVKWVRAMGRTFYDAARKPIRFDGVTLDITERKQAEEREKDMVAEATAATAKFRAVFEQTTQFAGILSNDGVLMEANRLSLEACGYSSEDVLGRPFWETAWWRNFPETQEKIRAATVRAAEGIPYREILPYSWGDGSEHVVDFALYPIRGVDGKVLCLHPTGIDITDLKRAEENSRRLAETLERQVQERTQELEARNADVLRQSEELRELSRGLLHAQDEERRRVARELHDSAGQTLTVLGMNLGILAQKAQRGATDLAKLSNESLDLVQQLHHEIRTASYLLYPPLLEESGLRSSLSHYAQGLKERSGMEVQLDIAEELGRLPREIELVAFRLVQEALTNIHRHSGSKKAYIRMARDGDHVGIEVRDEGKGIAPEKVGAIQAGRSGVGIRGMRERLRQFNGRLDIESDGTGTRVMARIPAEKLPA